jgi:pyrroloquinoline quinone biosynthesis protein B
VLGTLLFAVSCAHPIKPRAAVPLSGTEPYAIVLGIAQDGGAPQAGCERPDCIAAWNDPRLRRRVAALGIVDPVSGERWLIDATPDFPSQLHDLGGRVDGIFLTHAHIGHYIGLAQLGREVMGARGVPVYAMPRMRAFLEHNGPWDQLVRLHNIEIRDLADGVEVRLNERIVITPLLVPHRDEYSETAGFLIRGPSHSILWLPDIDKWEKWATPVESVVARTSVAYVDGTFHDAAELPGRDLREIPHPLMTETLARLQAQREKVRFIHLNQSNPALRRPITGVVVARDGERTPL